MGHENIFEKKGCLQLGFNLFNIVSSLLNKANNFL